MYGQSTVRRRVAHPEYHSLSAWLGRRRKPELVGASCPAVPGHGPERAGRGGHRGKHLVPGQDAKLSPHPAPRRPPADGGAHGHVRAQQHQGDSPGEHSASEPGQIRRARWYLPGPPRQRCPRQPASRRGPSPARWQAPTPFRAPGRHLIHPQSPGIRLTRTYPSRTQNTTPNEARPTPPSTCDARLHTSTPIASSAAPTASSARLHWCRGIRSARLMAVAPSAPRAPRYSLLAPATTRTAPQLTTSPATKDDVTWLTPTTQLPATASS